MVFGTALANTARTFSETWRIDKSDVTLVSLPMAWMFGLTTSSFSTLYAGGTVVSRRRSRPEIMAAAIETMKVTILPAVTTVLTKLANFLDEEGSTRDCSSLRLIVSGGEPRNEHSFAVLKAHRGQGAIWRGSGWKKLWTLSEQGDRCHPQNFRPSC